MTTRKSCECRVAVLSSCADIGSNELNDRAMTDAAEAPTTYAKNDCLIEEATEYASGPDQQPVTPHTGPPVGISVPQTLLAGLCTVLSNLGAILTRSRSRRSTQRTDDVVVLRW